MDDGDAGTDAIGPATLSERIRRGDRFTVLDVRDRDEFEAWHVDGPAVETRQLPHVRVLEATVQGTVDELVGDAPEPVVAVCAEGEASALVAEQLGEVGVDAVNLAGGMEAWGRLLVDLEVPVDGAATVRQYVRPSTGCLSYLVHDGTAAVAVDPLRAAVDRYVEDVREAGLELVAAVDTHVHADHLSGVRELADATGATATFPVGARDRGLAGDAETVGDGDALALGDVDLEVLALPGHTSELVGLRGPGVCFVGDTLFVDGVGRPDLERGQDATDAAATLYETLHERLFALPEDVLIAGGHVGPRTPPEDDGTYVATLGTLRERLDVLDCDREAFVDRVTSDLPPRPANHERLIAANLGSEELDEEEAARLELGPNNCAAGGGGTTAAGGGA